MRKTDKKMKGASRPQISFSAAPITGPVTNPEVSMAANLPKRSPAREASMFDTIARAAGANAPKPSPVKARAVVNSQTDEARANQRVPSTARTIEKSSRGFVFPRSASGAKKSCPRNEAKKEAPAIKPNALLANPKASCREAIRPKITPIEAVKLNIAKYRLLGTRIHIVCRIYIKTLLMVIKISEGSCISCLS